jgi:hypothetical protein
LPDKVEERWALERFQQASGEIAGEIVDTNREKPDFEVITAAGSVGVELTRYFRERGQRGSPIREAESLREELLRLAQENYDNPA